MRIFLVIIFFLSLTFTRQAFSFNADTSKVIKLIADAGELEKAASYSQEIDLAQRAYALSQTIGFSKGLSAACMRIGSAYFNLGKIDTALIYLKQAYAIRKENKSTKEVTSTCIMMSYVYVATARYDSAYSVLFDALRINQEAGDSFGKAETYVELGNLSIEYGDLAEAKKYLFEADKIATGLNSKEIKINVSSALGNYFFNTKEYKTALIYFLKVNNLIDINQEKTMYASNLNNIGLSYSALKLYKEATNYFQKGLNTYIELGMRFDEGNTSFNLGSMYNNRKMPDSAIFYLNKSMLIAREINDLRHVALSYEYMADAWILKKDYHKAYTYSILSSQLNDSILNAEKISTISEMQTKYETELKSKEIDILHQENDLTKLRASRSLSINIGLSAALAGIFVLAIIFYRQNKKKQKFNIALAAEKQKSDDLLLNILPGEVADELKANGKAKARQYNNVTVIFTDFVNFTGISGQMNPAELVEEIDKNFTAFDAIMEKFGVEKIKTIGDAYLAVCGLPNELPDHAERVVNAALEIQHFMKNNEGKFQIRIGINSGPVVAGIVGVKKFAYDIWGDTVNLAARMEQNSEADKINISGSTYELIKDKFSCTYRGKISAKNKGELDMYFVNEK